MKILITGGTGFVGSRLSRYLLEQGHHVTAIGTRAKSDPHPHHQYTYLQADTTRMGPWQESIPAVDLIINLAGKSIFHRWSRSYKRQLYDSRILTTRHLVEAIADGKDQTLISTSAVGYYGDSGDDRRDEDSPRGTDFLAGLAADWESEALAARSRGARVVIVRFGIILGAKGGALHTMLTAFRSFVGGPLGSGRQWVSWIHIADVVAALVFLIERRDLSGVFNLCTPNPIRNKEMSTLIGHTIGRPAKIAAPALALKVMMGELAEVLLGGQRVVPQRLSAAGFKFQFPELQPALEDLLA